MSHPFALRLLAPAKINLTLDVLRRRPNGYHDLDMLMMGVSLCDLVWIAPSPKSRVYYTGGSAPVNEPVEVSPAALDTVSRALLAYNARTRRACGAIVHVHKEIPSEAGLGGGSADAGAVLRAMQRLYNNALSQEALHDAALEVGADVPFCLHNDACRAGGVGEELIFLRTPRKSFFFLVVKPLQGISTGALFSSLQLPVPHPDTQAAQHALITGNAAALGNALQNALQPAAATLLPEIDHYCTRLLEAGALGAAMTGAGSAAFGLFPTEAAARAAYARFPDAAFRAVCHSLPGVRK